MKENKITKLFGTALTWADDHQREIFLGTQIVGTVTTMFLTWKAAKKADKALEKHKAKMEALEADFRSEDIGMTETEYKNRKRELVLEASKDIAPIVLPPVVTGAVTIGCAVGGYKASTKQIAALSAAYTLSEKALEKYTSKAEEMLGKKKALSITDEVNQDKVNANPPKSDTIINTGRGQVLCYDDYSGRYFYSDPESIRKTVNDINEQLLGDYFVSLNEFYDGLGLANIKLGDDIGFCSDDGQLCVSWSATLTKDNIPCLVLNYDVSPKYGFGDFSGRFNR